MKHYSVRLQEASVEPCSVNEFPFESDLVLGSLSLTLVPHTMNSNIINSVHVDAPSMTARRAMEMKSAAHDVQEIHSKTRHSIITPEHLLRTFNIGLDKARMALHATTQKGIRTAIDPIFRRYRVDHLNLHHDTLAGQ